MSLLNKVLLVDDDNTANYLHQLLLNRMGVADQIVVAENGQQALDILNSAAPAPQLILLDLNMPVMNGPEFLDYFVQLPAPRPVVVVLSSASQFLGSVRTGELPVAGYLEKPLTRPKLEAVLAQHFAAQPNAEA